MSCAPIALFVFNRPLHLSRTLAALQENLLARETALYVFCDGARRPEDVAKINEVRALVQGISGFKEVVVIEREINFGLAKSIIEGVTMLFNTHGRVIVVEDDLVTTSNFLTYMNAALNYYENNQKIFAIGGWSIAVNFDEKDAADVFYLPRTCSLGWGTWKDRWQNIDWAVSDYPAFKKNRRARRDFNKGGADLSRMLDLQMAGKIDSWAIRWCYAQYKRGLLMVVPKLSKLEHIGDGPDATHAVSASNYPLRLDDGSKTDFRFNDEALVDRDLLAQTNWYFSLPYKILNRLQNYGRQLLR